MLVYTCNPSPEIEAKAEVGGSHRQLQASLNYTVRLCFNLCSLPSPKGKSIIRYFV